MMKKFSFLLASALMAVSFTSCNSDSDDDDNREVTYARIMMVAMADQSGYTEYTATTAGYSLNMANIETGKLALLSVNTPEGNTLSLPTCLNMNVSKSSNGVSYIFNNGITSTFPNFGSDIPMSVVATLSSRVWTSYNSSNVSLGMSFDNGNRLAGFGGDLSFYTEATVTDSENPGEQFQTADESTNIVRIELQPSTTDLTANIYMYNANFDKNMPKKVDFLIENVSFEIDAREGTITFKTDEAIPYLLSNNVKGEPMPSFKITNLECVLSVGFESFREFSFTCAGHYQFSSLLTDAL